MHSFLLRYDCDHTNCWLATHRWSWQDGKATIHRQRWWKACVSFKLQCWKNNLLLVIPERLNSQLVRHPLLCLFASKQKNILTVVGEQEKECWWRKGLASWKEYREAIAECRDATRKAKTQLELNLMRKNNKNSFFMYINNKRKTIENTDLLLNYVGALGNRRHWEDSITECFLCSYLYC